MNKYLRLSKLSVLLVILNACASFNCDREPASTSNSCRQLFNLETTQASKPQKSSTSQITNLGQNYVSKHHQNATFVTGRSDYEYELVFNTPGFPGLRLKEDLEKANLKQGRLIDIGGGEGYATEAFVARYPNLKATLVSLETTAQDIYNPKTNILRRKVLRGKFIEDPSVILDEYLIATDLYGAAAYSPHPDVVLRKLVEKSTSDSVIYWHLGDNLDNFGMYNTVITHDGKILSFSEWLENIPGLNTQITKVNGFMPDTTIIANEKRRVARMTFNRPRKQIKINDLQCLSYTEGKPIDGFIVPRMVFIETAENHFIQPPQNLNLVSTPDSLMADFRTGHFEHQLLDRVEKLSRGQNWIHLSQEKLTVTKLKQAQVVETSYMGFINTRMSSRLSRIGNSLQLQSLQSIQQLPADRSASLLTDHEANFTKQLTPDLVLQKYIDAITDNGEIVLSLGAENTGLFSAMVLTTNNSKSLQFKDWLQQTPGIHVEFKKNRQIKNVTRQKINADGSSEDVNFEEPFYKDIAVITITDRAHIRFRPLKLLGIKSPNQDGLEVPAYLLL